VEEISDQQNVWASSWVLLVLFSQIHSETENQKKEEWKHLEYV
jgi:hypothetical protein